MSLVPLTVLLENVVADDDASVAAAAGLRLVGVDVIEDAAGTFEFYIVEGATGAAGTRKKPYKGVSGAVSHEWFWPGIDMSGGISIDWVSGDVLIALHFIHVPEG